MRSLLLILLAPLATAQPRLLLDDDFARMAQAVETQPWAAKIKADLLAAADAWPASHVARYALKQMELPPDGGQWWHWYVCPTSGVRLRFEAPDAHICPTDNRRITGWPYDQVIYAQRHDELAAAARDLALAYRLSGNRVYAERSAWILRAYAERYSAYPLHDINNKNTRTGGRAHAQTLDESIWLIPLAYSYDLIAATLTQEERALLERGLLRPAVETIRRYDAGISNWQSWHNAGVGAVAFALQDQPLIKSVSDGFRFQMERSTSADGFWYEGSFTYHYYALDALMQTAEMASRSGVDLWSEPRFRDLFAAPLRFSFADGTLAAFNDAVTVNLRNYNRWYESAFLHWGDPQFAAAAAARTRGKDALVFGVPELPAGATPPLESAIFADSGFAVLRSSTDHALILKYGPHGGGHGHNDKLSFVSYALGGILGVDPGTQAYSAPTHDTWDKSTVAHNTVVIDERNQAEATGSLLYSDFAGGAAIARASAGPAYSSVALERTLVHTAEYALDIFDARARDGQEHAIDWIYHNEGAVRTALPLTTTTLARQNGYQHLSNNRQARTDNEWQLTFDGAQAGGATYGSTFASTTNVKATFSYSRAQAYAGLGSGRMTYELAGPGYLLYTAPAGTQPPGAIPTSVRLAVYGDGSRHKLYLRVNDASDERFVTPLATLDFTGWRVFEIRDPANWPQHYLGNNDGNVDLPIRNVTLELQQDSTGPRQGELFVDQIELGFGDDEALVAGFESAIRSLRLWMLSTPGTTVVTGNGLGPDLTKPVPYAMARRRARDTRFATLLEPYGGTTPGIVAFRQPSDGVWLVTGPAWEDRIEFTAEGVTYTRH